MTEKKMENPYYALGEAFVSSVVAGNRGKLTGNQVGLSDRLRQYSYYVTENAIEAGDALLANDLWTPPVNWSRWLADRLPQSRMESISDGLCRRHEGPAWRMIMCHMLADREAELHAMADTIGVARKWYQGDHYDICLAKRNAAIRAGAKECTRRDMIKVRTAYRALHTS